ncbi:adenylosuccinate synthetase [uncultured Variovorax sp.]|uniref:adenylosuccinate synthetase n=1 Tax=uncultured Variovorax sp. TaxID=114708 RepID=UPI0025DD6127|nr:adenylosuccinate synthetase [uncultured Variovorax sp.]
MTAHADTHYVSVLGLGFGDCGKGLFTDHFSAAPGAHTVVRFNGGAQAGHNVVLADGRHHTFSQFGAGSFLAGVGTVLASPVVVHPTALRVEEAALRQVGVQDAFARLLIDARCRVTTPFHQAAGRLREWQRGEAAHGSCGVGMGETVRQALASPDAALRYGDLRRTALALEKVEALRNTLLREFEASPVLHHADAAQEIDMLRDGTLARRWLEAAAPCVAQSAPASIDRIAQRLSRPGTVVFEGAQGVLLDEWHGFHPHTTWSTISTAAVEAVLHEAGIDAPVQHLGVLRTYLTRHGAGPLPTHDPMLDAQLAEPHNADEGWQGAFRRGHPDAVLLRYALDVVGPLDGLVVSHLDAIERAGLRWCSGYRTADVGRIASLPLGGVRDLDHQQALTQLLQGAEPLYEPHFIATPHAWVEHAEASSGLPVRLGSFGPTRESVRGRKHLP